MKKLIKILFATLLTMLITLPVNAQELTVEKGTYLEVGQTEEITTVNVYNEQDKPLWKNIEVENIDGMANIFIPLNNPLKTIHVHIVKGDEESVLKVNLTEPHEHMGQHVEFIRPTETEAGRMEYFVCDCGKYFEDRACTKEITEDIDTWSYIAPVPKEEWNGPVAVVERYDGKQVTDDYKPNPTWTEEQVNNYYEKEEVEIQTELEERKEESIKTDDAIENADDVIETNETIEPVVLSVKPVEVEEPTLWERIKDFFANLFE